MVLDGAIRDVAEIRERIFSVYARGALRELIDLLWSQGARGIAVPREERIAAARP